MKYGIIYKITNKINGKVYIGKTVQPFKRRCRKNAYKSCTALNNSINIHGWDNFDKEEFISALDEKYLAELEEMTIKHFDCIAPKGYNIIQIDKGLNRYSEETKHKIRLARIEAVKNQVNPVIQPNRAVGTEIHGILHKDCTECKTLKPMTEFAKNVSRWDGYARVCKVCFHAKYNSKQDRRTLTPEQMIDSYKGRQDPDKQRQRFLDNPEARNLVSKRLSKPITGTNIETGEIIEFSSALAAKSAGFQNSNIGVAIKNKTVYKKYTWRFK